MNKTIRELSGRIIALAIGNIDHDIFVEYMAHVELLQVRIFEGGWQSGDMGRKIDVYLTDEGAESNLLRIIEQLESLLS
jgi:hypothetical protein